jgi:hypothetical protein
MTKSQIAILTTLILATLVIIAAILLFKFQPALFLPPTPTQAPTLPPTKTLVPSLTSIPPTFPPTWTPLPSSTPGATATARISPTPSKTPTVSAALKTAIAQSFKGLPAPGSSGGSLDGLPGGNCEPVLMGAYIKITGSIKNNTNVLIGTVWMRGNIYDKNKNLINTHASIADSDQIAPGQTSTYSIYIDDPNRQFDSCSVEFEKVEYKK